MRTLFSILILGLGVITLPGCLDEKRTALQDGLDTTPVVVARFDPSNSDIPYPNNLLFKDSSDGTLNIPAEDPNDYADPVVALNTLDGFSTLAPMTAGFSAAVDPDTVVAGDTIRIFEVTTDPATGAVTGYIRELAGDAEYMTSVDTTGTVLTILPMRPLDAATSYQVVITTGVMDARGHSIRPDTTYAITKGTDPLFDEEGRTAAGQLGAFADLSDEELAGLEGLRQLTNAAEGVIAANSSLDTSDIVLSWTFSTQSVGAVLATVEASATAGAIATTATGMTTRDVLGDASPGIANIHTGTLEVPYYLQAPTGEDPTAPLTGFWQGLGGSFLTRYNAAPVKTTDVTIPLLMTVPQGETPTGGWPVVIFQHGITADRTSLLGIADTLAQAGFAAVAIDLPLHGVTDTDNPFYADANERHFGLDFVNNATGAAGPDGQTDSSGTHFINLKSLLTARDNLRQAVADLFVLRRSLNGLENIDGDRVFFLGHSLGAMVGTVFLALDDSVQDAVLAMPGGGIAKLLDGSASFGPVVAAGLAEAGISKGTTDYESFLGAAQTVLDTTDPINHAARTADGRGVLMFEVVGGASSLPDQVVPNNVFADAPAGTVPSPTAGTDPLGIAMGLTRYSATINGVDLAAWVRFTAGDHSSILDPAADADTTAEMQGQAAAFLASGGITLQVSNNAVIEDQGGE